MLPKPWSAPPRLIFAASVIATGTALCNLTIGGIHGVRGLIAVLFWGYVATTLVIVSAGALSNYVLAKRGRGIDTWDSMVVMYITLTVVSVCLLLLGRTVFAGGKSSRRLQVLLDQEGKLVERWWDRGGNIGGELTSAEQSQLLQLGEQIAGIMHQRPDAVIYNNAGWTGTPDADYLRR